LPTPSVEASIEGDSWLLLLPIMRRLVLSALSKYYAASFSCVYHGLSYECSSALHSPSSRSSIQAKAQRSIVYQSISVRQSPSFLRFILLRLSHHLCYVFTFYVDAVGR
jgi:hypothetical protein